MQLKPLGKVIVLILVLGVAAGVWRFWKNLAPPPAIKTAVVPSVGTLPSTTGGADFGSGMGSTIPVVQSLNGGEIRLLGYAWNAQMGMLYANGGATTQPGSIMQKHDVNLHFIRQDDNSKIQEMLTTFADRLSKGDQNPTEGAQFCCIMGDGSAAFLQGLNQTLGKLGPQYRAKIVDAIGYSHGEDKLMGPKEWRTNPNAARGSFVAGVVRDGDWNIAQKWLSDNQIPTNPDEKTYDPNAMNWVNASDYTDAAAKVVAGYSEDRPVVVNGKRTGETRHVTVNGCVTWTPGDVTVAEKKGGYVSVVSTREYNTQMPCVVIGIDAWMRSHRPIVERMIQAIAEGSATINSNPAALSKGAQISADVYHEPGADAAYWEKYFKGTTQNDAIGQPVELGGSSVNDLPHTMLSFGLVPGSADLVSATYTVFGNLVASQYPELVKSIDPANTVVDSSYVRNAGHSSAPTHQMMVAARPTYKPTSSHTAAVVGHRIWNIHFDPGSATFSPDAKNMLRQLSSDLLIAGGTVVEIHGYTDNQGSHSTSLPLSQSRASAVQHYLENVAPVNFPRGRIHAYAHGEANPVANNATADGRAKNRRVEIVLRSVS